MSTYIREDKEKLLGIIAEEKGIGIEELLSEKVIFLAEVPNVCVACEMVSTTKRPDDKWQKCLHCGEYACWSVISLGRL